MMLISPVVKQSVRVASSSHQRARSAGSLIPKPGDGHAHLLPGQSPELVVRR